MMELLELVLGILEALFGVEELLHYWRFSVASGLSIALAIVLYLNLPWGTANTIISVFSGIAGLVGGVIWESSHRRY